MSYYLVHKQLYKKKQEEIELEVNKLINDAIHNGEYEIFKYLHMFLRQSYADKLSTGIRKKIVKFNSLSKFAKKIP